MIALCRSASILSFSMFEVSLQDTFSIFFYSYGVAAGYVELAFQAIGIVSSKQDLLQGFG